MKLFSATSERLAKQIRNNDTLNSTGTVFLHPHDSPAAHFPNPSASDDNLLRIDIHRN